MQNHIDHFELGQCEIELGMSEDISIAFLLSSGIRYLEQFLKLKTCTGALPRRQATGLLKSLFSVNHIKHLRLLQATRKKLKLLLFNYRG
jgi:hypothetical protein